MNKKHYHKKSTTHLQPWRPSPFQQLQQLPSCLIRLPYSFLLLLPSSSVLQRPVSFNK
jgi:hypothetical protein